MKEAVGAHDKDNDMSTNCHDMKKSVYGDYEIVSSFHPSHSSSSSSSSSSSDTDGAANGARSPSDHRIVRKKKHENVSRNRRDRENGVDSEREVEEEEQEDEWLQGTPASKFRTNKGGSGGGGGGKKKKKGGKKKVGKRGGNGGGGIGATETASSSTYEIACSLPASIVGFLSEASRALSPEKRSKAKAALNHTRRSSSGCSSRSSVDETNSVMTSTAGAVGAEGTEAAAAAAAATTIQAKAKHKIKIVQWGEVVVHTCRRKPSPDSVPAHGAWPLGLGAEDGHPPRLTTVDRFEVAKQEELERRLQELPKRLRKATAAGGGGLETRQFDYKSPGEKNPLFGPLDERRRKLVLIQALEQGEGGKEEEGLCGSPRKMGMETSAYLNLYNAMEEQEEARSNELDELRASRKKIGCSCHHTSKAPDKLSLKKLKEELHRRHLSAPGTDKAILVEQLKEVLKDERLCNAEGGPVECECLTAGVPCHADVCGCCAGKKPGRGVGGGGVGRVRIPRGISCTRRRV